MLVFGKFQLFLIVTLITVIGFNGISKQNKVCNGINQSHYIKYKNQCEKP